MSNHLCIAEIVAKSTRLERVDREIVALTQLRERIIKENSNAAGFRYRGKIMNHTLLNSFIAYCIAHPEERFWQALRNWAGVGFIYTSTTPIEADGLEDTFYK